MLKEIFEQPQVIQKIINTRTSGSKIHFDELKISADALAKKDGWVEVPEKDVAHAFKGDAVFFNNRIAVTLRQGGRRADVYSIEPKGLTLRARLVPIPFSERPHWAKQRSDVRPQW